MRRGGILSTSEFFLSGWVVLETGLGVNLVSTQAQVSQLDGGMDICDGGEDDSQCVGDVSHMRGV